MPSFHNYSALQASESTLPIWLLCFHHPMFILMCFFHHVAWVLLTLGGFSAAFGPACLSLLWSLQYCLPPAKAKLVQKQLTLDDLGLQRFNISISTFLAASSTLHMHAGAPQNPGAHAKRKVGDQ